MSNLFDSLGQGLSCLKTLEARLSVITARVILKIERDSLFFLQINRATCPNSLCFWMKEEILSRSLRGASVLLFVSDTLLSCTGAVLCMILISWLSEVDLILLNPVEFVAVV